MQYPTEPSPEEEYFGVSSIEKRKKLGQFFTPAPIAKFMVNWATRGNKVESFLDPAVGLGVFIEEYTEICKQIGNGTVGKVYGYEIDSQVLAVAKKHLAKRTLATADLRQEDFLLAKPAEASFDAIVCNPPYYKHHFVRNKDSIVRQLKDTFRVEFPGTLSSYALFLLKAMALIADKGRCAFITPSEFLNADYGVSIKNQLIRSGTLRAIIFFDPSLVVFDSGLTTSAITLLENDPKHTSHETALIWIKEERHIQPVLDLLLLGGSDIPSLHEELKHFADVRVLRTDVLEPQKKWPSYFTSLPELQIPLIPLRDYGQCMRGIATGANAFFTLSTKDLEAAGLRREETLPCITKAAHLTGYVLDDENWGKIKKTDCKWALLNVREPLSPAARRYIEKGKARGIAQLYLPSHRPTWYVPEQRPAADLLIPVFFRERWRVVLNAAAVRNLTTFHGFYLNAAARALRGSLFLYLNTPLCLEILRQVLRRYGDGLNKVEPRDVESLLVPDFGELDPDSSARLGSLAEQLIRTKREALAEEIVLEADRIFRAARPRLGPLGTAQCREESLSIQDQLAAGKLDIKK